jgi:hypothetical protein
MMKAEMEPYHMLENRSTLLKEFMYARERFRYKACRNVRHFLEWNGPNSYGSTRILFVQSVRRHDQSAGPVRA